MGLVPQDETKLAFEVRGTFIAPSTVRLCHTLGVADPFCRRAFQVPLESHHVFRQDLGVRPTSSRASGDALHHREVGLFVLQDEFRMNAWRKLFTKYWVQACPVPVAPHSGQR